MTVGELKEIVNSIPSEDDDKRVFEFRGNRYYDFDLYGLDECEVQAEYYVYQGYCVDMDPGYW